MAKTRDYNKIAKARIVRPGDNPNPFRRILVYGKKKVGKTTFAATAPNVLIVDPEKGTETMVRKNPQVWPVTKWEDYQDVWGYLRKGDHPYEWVTFDGTTRMNNMALKYVGKVQEERDLDRIPGMTDRRDYNKSGELMKTMLNQFLGLRMGIVFCAHERIIQTGRFDEDTDEDSEDAPIFYVPDLPDGVRGHLNGIVDVIGRLDWKRVQLRNPKTKEVFTRKQRQLYVGLHERLDTGPRSDFELPDIIKNPTVPKLVQLMLEGE
jgi:hypothetical protein